MLIGRVARGGSLELNLGGDERRRNIVHLEQMYETAQSSLLTVTLFLASGDQGRWKVGGKAPPKFFSAPHRNFYPSFSPPFQKFITTVHPIALQRWFMASLVIRFFFSSL